MVWLHSMNFIAVGGSKGNIKLWSVPVAFKIYAETKELRHKLHELNRAHQELEEAFDASSRTRKAENAAEREHILAQITAAEQNGQKAPAIYTLQIPFAESFDVGRRSSEMSSGNTDAEEGTGVVWSLAWSDSNNTLASAGKDGAGEYTVRVWKVEQGEGPEPSSECLVVLRNHGANCLTWSEDTLLAGCEDGRVWFWRTPEIRAFRA